MTSNTVAKIVVTAAALGATAANALLGAKAAQAGGYPVEGATDPTASTPRAAASAQRSLRYLQWAEPMLTGVILVLGAQQGEQQRPSQILSGLGGTLARRVTNA